MGETVAIVEIIQGIADPVIPSSSRPWTP
jgi:hypothetical protein